ncbi:MAG: hypothetical protein Q3995_04960 [Eubacteriales bacterium]|nr:hypothetical protein [Eubacteriales bacterium]
MARRQQPPQWYVKFQNWLVLKLDGVKLDPIFCVAFFVLAVGSLIRGIVFEKSNMFYSAAICALAGVMILRRIGRIKKQEANAKEQNGEE